VKSVNKLFGYLSVVVLAVNVQAQTLVADSVAYQKHVLKMSSSRLAGDLATNFTSMAWHCGAQMARSVSDDIQAGRAPRGLETKSPKCQSASMLFRVAKTEFIQRQRDDLVRQRLIDPRVTTYPFSVTIPGFPWLVSKSQGEGFCLERAKEIHSEIVNLQVSGPTDELIKIHAGRAKPITLACTARQREREPVANLSCESTPLETGSAMLNFAPTEIDKSLHLKRFVSLNDFTNHSARFFNSADDQMIPQSTQVPILQRVPHIPKNLHATFLLDGSASSSISTVSPADSVDLYEKFSDNTREDQAARRILMNQRRYGFNADLDIDFSAGTATITTRGQQDFNKVTCSVSSKVPVKIAGSVVVSK
jgi:hypothetical protein